MNLSPYIVNFSQIHKIDEDLVGRKAHELGDLWKLGISIPNGFIITAQFHKEFQRLGDIPQTLAIELHRHYRELSGLFREQPMNIFSSSYNGRSIKFLNVKGDANLILKIKTIWSLSPDRFVAIAVQENIKSEIKGKVATNKPTVDKKLTEEQMDKLINYCKVIQKYSYFPKEIEYAVKKNKLYITQINPFTGTVNDLLKKFSQNNKTRKVAARGVSVNPGIATGRVKVLRDIHSRIKVKKGEVVILSMLDSSLFNKIRNARAIVTDLIFPNSLDKTLYRRAFHVPTVEGTRNATKIFENGNVITVNGVSGEIYSGGLIC